jgi:hypothetical protein
MIKKKNFGKESKQRKQVTDARRRFCLLMPKIRSGPGWAVAERSKASLQMTSVQ